MTTDELNISAAVQRYEVSRKTVRRRLAEGAIEGARQEAGDHGPEWVFPAASLEALGYAQRPGSGAAAADVPGGDPSPEGALPFDETPQSAPRGRRRELIVAVAVIVGLLLGFLGASLVRSDEAPSDPLEALLEELTRSGDEIGLVGSPRDVQLPAGRVPVLVADLADLAEAPRYVVIDDDGDPATLDALLAGAKPVLALERSAGSLWLFDTGGDPLPASSTSEVTANSTPAKSTTSVAPAGPSITSPTTTTPTVTGPPATTSTTSTTAPDGGPPVEAEPSEGDPTDPAVDPSTATRVTVVAGDSFWTIAEDVVAQSLGTTPTDAQVTGYWAALVDANVDSLVQPGNPDLILPGQVFQLPSI